MRFEEGFKVRECVSNEFGTSGRLRGDISVDELLPTRTTYVRDLHMCMYVSPVVSHLEHACDLHEGTVPAYGT
jgi:hypothetical protein